MKRAMDALLALHARQRVASALQLLLLLAVLGLHASALRYAFLSRAFSFPDFRCYYMAAALYWSHGNPYDRGQTYFPFVYAPTTLYLFKCFCIYFIWEAERRWFVVKCAVLFLLVYIWTKHFSLRLGLKEGLILACGFTFTVVQDLITGNVSLVEQVLLWAGLAALTRRRYWIFGACLVLASQFKLLFLVFLPCLFLIDGDAPERRKQWIALAGTMGIFAGTLLIDFLIRPSWYQDMAANIARIDYNGANCDPSSRAFLEDVVLAMGSKLSPAHVGLIVLSLYLAFGICIAIVSGRALLEHRRQNGSYDAPACILFACVIYALVLPRLKLYSCVLILPPAMYMAARARGWPAAALFALCLLPTHNLLYPFQSIPRTIAAAYDSVHIPALISNYTTFFALFGLWVWFVSRFHGRHKQSGPPLSVGERRPA